MDPEAIARSSVVAMANAMGSTYVSQPDVKRELWADSPGGIGDEYDEDLDRMWSSDGGERLPPRKQHHQQLAAQPAEEREAAEQMAVDR